MLRHTAPAALAILAASLSAACSNQKSEEPAAQKSNLTPGVVKLTIIKNQTTQAQITEVFGPPDLVTHKDDMQVWTYDKTNYDYQSSSGYLTVIFAGIGGDTVRSSSRSTVLIIYFDNNDKVIDYRLSAVKY